MTKVYLGWVWDRHFGEFADFKVHERRIIVTNNLDKWVKGRDRYEAGIMQIDIPVITSPVPEGPAKIIRKATPQKTSGRPCNSRSRQANRWTRTELEKLAKQNGIAHISKKNMDQLCRELKL